VFRHSWSLSSIKRHARNATCVSINLPCTELALGARPNRFWSRPADGRLCRGGAAEEPTRRELMRKVLVVSAILQFALSAAAAQSQTAASKAEVLSLEQETRDKNRAIDYEADRAPFRRQFLDRSGYRCACGNPASFPPTGGGTIGTATSRLRLRRCRRTNCTR
jgi:hypothetical protein